MSCILGEAFALIKETEEFKNWAQAIKKEYPSKTEEEIEESLRTFLEINNGNFPGRTPAGMESKTFEQLAKAYDGNKVIAMEIYRMLFDKDFIEDFGNWCGMEMDTTGLTEEQIKLREQEDEEKLKKAALNQVGEPALFFVNSIRHLSSNSTAAAVNKNDSNLPFKIIVENGEARAEGIYGRPVQSGSITFVIAKNYTTPFSTDDIITIDQDEVYKAYDFNAENKRFTQKRLTTFLTQSSGDLYYISRAISNINGKLKEASDTIHSREDAIEFIRSKNKNLIFDDDVNSPFGGILLMTMTRSSKTVWLIVSPEGIFYSSNRYKLGTGRTEASLTYVDKLANAFFIDSGYYKQIINYITGIVEVVKPDSHLQSPMVDYFGDHYVLKPSQNRTQHNIKTELGLAYAVFMVKKKPEQFTMYLNWAKLFSEIRQNSVGVGTVNEVNMVGNFIGSILSGELIDSNYYTAHSFDVKAAEQAVFVSRHKEVIRDIVAKLWGNITDDIPNSKIKELDTKVKSLSDLYKEIDFSDIADSISRNRTISKVVDDTASYSFCDTIDKVKAAYGYRRNDSGSRKQYDATEYTKIVATYEQLNVLNKDITEYLINKSGKEETVSGENLENLISKYLTCISTIVGIMDDDISRIEYFIRNTPQKYTVEYYQQLLYFDRSVIKMYKKQKDIVEKLFNLDSSTSDIILTSLYNIFTQRQVRTFEELRDRYYKNYASLSNLRTIQDKTGSLESIIHTMIEDAISHFIDEWCDENLKCLTEDEERYYRLSLKLDLEGHIDAGISVDTWIGGSASSSHSIVNVLYRIILTLGKRSNLLIKTKGDNLMKKFKSTFGNHSPFNQCKLFCEILDGKTTGYFIRPVNYGMYFTAKVAKQKELLEKLPTEEGTGAPLYYKIDALKSTKTKLVIEWLPGSQKYQNAFLDDMDRWILENANRRYNALYYIDRRNILGKDRIIDGNKIIVGNEAANRQNVLRRQIDGIKNRYRDKDTGVFLPFKVPPVLKKILDNLEYQLSSLASPYERYTSSDGKTGIREKQGLDLAVALNIQEWNKFIQDKRSYGLDVERYNEVEQKLHDRIGKDLTKEEYDAFVSYYHRTQAKQEYYDTLEEMYKGGYGKYQDLIDDIRFRRRSILARVKHGKKGLLQMPNLDDLDNSEWEELTRLDIEEDKIRKSLPPRFNTITPITTSSAVVNEATKETFVNEHVAKNKLHTYTDDEGESHILSVYYISTPSEEDMIEDVLTDEFSVESSEYTDTTGFDPSNPSYELPRAYRYDFKSKKQTKEKLYKNDKYDDILKNTALFDLYNEFLNIMKEANEMFGYAAISSNYKLPQIYEKEASIYLGRGCGAINSFKYKMKRSFYIDERDLDRSYTSDIHADATSSGKLRKRFVEMLSDPEHISTDLVYSVMAYYTVACRYSDKLDILALCELINRKIQSSSDKDTILKTQANNAVETFLFENTMDTDSTVAAGVEKFLDHTTAMLLKWKLKTVIKAFLDGYRLFTNIALSDKWGMRGHFLNAVFGSIKNTFTSIRSDIDVLDYNLDEALMSLNNVNIQSYADANKSKFTRAYFKSGMMPMLTAIDHITTKAIMRAVYDSIRLYKNPDGKTMLFLNIEEFVNMYKKDHSKDGLSPEVIEELARLLFWGEKGNKAVTLRDAYQLGKRNKDGKIIKGTENILSIKDEYAHMFSDNDKVNDDQWAIIQTRVQGLLDEMAASINGYKTEDSRAGTVAKKWYLKPIFQIRSFLVANYNELFKSSTTLKELIPDTTTKNTVSYKPKELHSENSTAEKINKFWATDNGLRQFINKITSEREMYNVLTGTKDGGYYFATMSYIRKLIENLIIYIGSTLKHEKKDYRNITNVEKASVINAFIVLAEAGAYYNLAVFVGGLLSCLLSLGSDPDDEDEWFVHWFLWTLYDIAGSLFNDTLLNVFFISGTIEDIFRNILAAIPVLEQFKKTLFESRGNAMEYVKSLFGDDELFEDPLYGNNDSPFNLQKSGKWQGEMYGKRAFYDVVQNAPWLLSPVISWPVTFALSTYIPEIPISNVKESFSARAARAKASFTFNNLSPIDYFRLGTPSSTDESWDKFHTYNWWTKGALALNSLTNSLSSEEEILDFIRSASTSPYTPIPTMSPVDMVERKIPLGREYE